MGTEGHASVFGRLVETLVDVCVRFYGDRLVSLAVFGSVGRGTARSDSDIDLMLVADPLPKGRMPRVREFEAGVLAALGPALDAAARAGVSTRLSPLFKTKAEAVAGSPLFLDMTEDARILFDRDSFLAGRLDALRGRMRELGSRRVRRGDMWFWDLKPDFRRGEVIEL